jgi:GTP-binding protein
MPNKPIIAIIGRPNVGKSTLYNRLTKSRDAIVANVPGVTRDRQYGVAKLGKQEYIVVDTGGFEPLIDGGVMYQMLLHAKTAIAESDAIVLVVDGRSGIVAQDKLIANQIRGIGKPIYVAVNKAEGLSTATAISDFYELGLNKLHALSASNGDGVIPLFTTILTDLTTNNSIFNKNESQQDLQPATAKRITFAIIGRPNVGKSTLVNTMLGEQRMIVFDEAGTTRDSIFIDFEKMETAYTIIDTAGIRRRGKVKDKIETFSVIKSLDAISTAQVILLILDATLDIAEQDANIIGYALDQGKSIIVVINKWDSLSVEQRTNIKQNIGYKLHFLDFAEFHYISALRNRGITPLFKSINQAHASAFANLSTAKLTRTLLEAVKRQPPAYKGKFRPKLRYAHQGGSNPPLIVIHGNSVDKIALAYTKYLERTFQNTFKLVGTPVRIEYKTNNNPFENKV